jgi:hypothetical protein
MKHFTGFLIITTCLFFSTDAYAQPDSLRRLDIQCGNDQPLPSLRDSLYGPWPELNTSAKYSVLSPDMSLLSFYFESLVEPFIDGVQVYDLRHQRKIVLIPRQFVSRWHPFEHKLLTANYIYNIDSDEFKYLPESLNGNSEANWAPDGKSIYIRTDQLNLLRTDQDGSNPEYMPNLRRDFIPVSDSTFFSFHPSGIELRDIAGRNNHIVELRWMRDVNPHLINNVSVSYDGRFVLADFRPKGAGRYDDEWFLGMVDLSTFMLKEVLRGQRLGNEYYASWTSRHTILVSYVCREDSVRGIWEVDTNGIFLRQLFGKDQFSELTNVAQAPSAPSGFSILSFFPHPGNREGFIEFDIEKRGMYALHLIDLSGRAVRVVEESSRREPGAYRRPLRLDDLPPGMYLIRLSNERNQSVYHRLIVGP